MGKQHEISEVTLADGLVALIQRIEPTRKTGLVVIRSEVSVLLDGLYAMLDEARHLQGIADAAQWNAKARRDAIRAESLALEEAIAGSGNVTKFPVAPRLTAFRRPDGEGGAA